MNSKTGWEAYKSQREAERRASFFNALEGLNQRIRSAHHVENAVAGMTGDICALLGCDRLTLYAVAPNKTTIESWIKTGMDSFKNFSLPISNSSIAGHVALTRRSFNIRDVYDESELQAHARDLRFLDKVDLRIGYRTREMIAAPILGEHGEELLGVLQILNNRLGGPFSSLIEDGVRELCKALAQALERRGSTPVPVHTRFDPLAVIGALSPAELGLAKRFARRKQLYLEDVLTDVFKVGLDQLGAAYSHFFRVPYEPFREGRQKSALLNRISREYASHNEWLVLANSESALTVMAVDPERLSAARRVEGLFPKHAVSYCVTTRREFVQTLEQLYAPSVEGDASPQADTALLQRIERIIADALATAAPELQAVTHATSAQARRTNGAEDGRLTVTLEVICHAPQTGPTQ